MVTKKTIELRYYPDLENIEIGEVMAYRYDITKVRLFNEKSDHIKTINEQFDKERKGLEDKSRAKAQEMIEIYKVDAQKQKQAMVEALVRQGQSVIVPQIYIPTEEELLPSILAKLEHDFQERLSRVIGSDNEEISIINSKMRFVFDEDLLHSNAFAVRGRVPQEEGVTQVIFKKHIAKTSGGVEGWVFVPKGVQGFNLNETSPYPWTYYPFHRLPLRRIRMETKDNDTKFYVDTFVENMTEYYFGKAKKTEPGSAEWLQTLCELAREEVRLEEELKKNG